MNPATAFYLDLYKRCLDLRRTVIWSVMGLNLGLLITLFTSRDILVGSLAFHWLGTTIYLFVFLAGWSAYLVLIYRMDVQSRKLLEFISADISISMEDVDRLYLNYTSSLKYWPIGFSALISLLVLLPLHPIRG
jgi:hypothetical protein